MTTEMKQYEAWCIEYAKKKFPKKDQWDNFIIAKDAYLEGFKKCREEACNIIDKSKDALFDGQMQAYLNTRELGNEVIKVELSSNQIGQNND